MADLPDYNLELTLTRRGHRRVAGIDEVGRGPWAGPVVACAVVLDPLCIPEGLNDSKKLTGPARTRLTAILVECAEVSVGHATVDEIDRLNILRASHLAMVRALSGLARVPDAVLVDGNMIPAGLPCPAQAVIGGDALSVSIAAASIVAKIRRDLGMVALAQQHPGYGWETNVGYGTRQHQEALRSLGVTPHHRRSFKPIHKMLYQEAPANL